MYLAEEERPQIALAHGSGQICLMHFRAKHGAKIADKKFPLLTGGSNAGGDHARQFGSQAGLPFLFFVQIQELDHLSMLASAENSLPIRWTQLAMEAAEIIAATHRVMRQQHARAKGNKSAIHYVKVKLVLM